MIRLIAAIDQKRGIAKHGNQPWYIPEDEKYFRQQTMRYGGNVLMGRKLFELIGHPLQNRSNVILSQNQAKIEGVTTCTDLSIINSLSDVWIIGGESVFSQVIENADELYLTHIEADFGCDKFFPEYEKSFELMRESTLKEQNGFLFRYSVYRRR